MNRFATGLLVRVGLLSLTGFGLGWVTALAIPSGQGLWLGFGLIAIGWQAAGLYRYVTGVNRKLTRFLESVQYADFTSTFRADNGLGPSFQGLNEQFNTVLDAFRQVRAESEANLQFLNTIVQHVTVGLITFDGTGRVELVNQATLRLLGMYRLRQLTDLQAAHPPLLAMLTARTQPESAIYRTQEQTELSVRCTTVRLRGRLLTVVSLQNIQSELQQKEVEAWQKLTSVLRHEIMNSLTPIVSLVGTMRDILDQDLFPDSPDSPSSFSSPSSPYSPATLSSLADIRLALSTIENRGQGIMQFVDAYRHFTTIPLPNRTQLSVSTLLASVMTFVGTDAQHRQVDWQLTVSPDPLWIMADAAQVEMVLINLLRNALDSLYDWPNPTIILSGFVDQGRSCIGVRDNGPGIAADALSKIFIPFFSTKPNGSGIGLSLSRQIMQAHGGQLTVQSEPGQGSLFTLVFPD